MIFFLIQEFGSRKIYECEMIILVFCHWKIKKSYRKSGLMDGGKAHTQLFTTTPGEAKAIE